MTDASSVRLLNPLCILVMHLDVGLKKCTLTCHSSRADDDPLDSGPVLGFFPQGDFSWPLSQFVALGVQLVFFFFLFSLFNCASTVRRVWVLLSAIHIKELID